MGVMYREIYERNTVRGVEISDMKVKYPVSEIVGRTDGCFDKTAEKFAEEVRRNMFAHDGEEFFRYVESGGRRSVFPRRGYRLFINEVGRNGRYVSIKTEAFVTVSNVGIMGYCTEYTVWDTGTGLVCDAGTLGVKGVNAHDGFFIDGNGIRYYDVEGEFSRQGSQVSVSDYIKCDKNI